MSMNEYDNEKEKDMTENATAGENAAVNENTAAVAPRAGKSRGGRVSRIILAAVILVFIVWFGFTFRLREGSCAIVLRFGAPRSQVTEAGIHMRLPWPFETVTDYDSRLQYLETAYLETITGDKRNIIIQPYIIWRIEDPLLYHNSVGASGNIDSYIRDQVFSATNSILGGYDLSNIVSLESESIKTEEIQQAITDTVAAKCRANYGIEVLNVRILRLSLPDTNLQSVFDQMTAERQKDIDTILANADRDANRIMTEADAQAASIIADGTTKAAEIKAAAEAEVASIYAAAQDANLELYTFLRRLDTAVSSVGDSTVLIVDTDTYPFTVLRDYSDMLSGDGDAGNRTVLKDLTYILSQLPEKDAEALSNAIYKLIENASAGTLPEAPAAGQEAEGTAQS